LSAIHVSNQSSTMLPPRLHAESDKHRDLTAGRLGKLSMVSLLVASIAARDSSSLLERCRAPEGTNWPCGRPFTVMCRPRELRQEGVGLLSRSQRNLLG
jgi:hypothetical protein